MVAEEELNDNTSRPPANGSGVISGGKYYFYRIFARMNPIWRAAFRFARWYETQAVREAAVDQQMKFDISSPERVRFLAQLPKDVNFEPEDSAELWRFLYEIGVRRLVLGPRLESNQITDIVTLLLAYRRHLVGRNSAKPVVSALLSQQGLSFACTSTSVKDGELQIYYSYCTTCFSRFVAWFKERHRNLSDHRALFRAAPRYGMAVGGIVVGLFLAGVFIRNVYFEIALGLFTFATLFVLTYLFFMTIGSLEYDNEEKAYRLARTNRSLQTYTDRIRRDLSRAQTVQEKLIPASENMPLSDRLEWASSFKPEIEVGGDYFDAIKLGPDKVAVLLSDVSGHGMSAALVTAIIKTSFHYCSQTGATGKEFLSDLNNLLVETTPVESFAATCMAMYDAATGESQYINCGHNPEPLIIHGEGEPPVECMCRPGALLLGVEKDIDLPVGQTRLSAGDKALFVTDGITEAVNEAGEMFGRERLDEYLREHRREGAKTLVDGLVKCVNDFTAGLEQSDDQTILAFAVK